jgi:TRAP-type C4-dicarboxylate transport system substrate-binding protein
MAWTKLIAAVAVMAASGADAADPVSLKLAMPSPAVSPINTQLLVPWSEDVGKASGGAVEIKIFAGAAIANYANVLDRVTNAVADIGWGGHGYYPTQFAKSFVAMLPFETRNAKEACGALWALYEKGLIADEYQSMKLIGFGDFPNVSLHSRKPIATLADMRGLKVVALSRAVGQALEKLEAAPIVLQFTEVYQALQRGTVDAVAGGFPTVPSLKLTEVTSHHLVTSLGTEAMFLFMNKDSYARLPEAGRGAVDRLSGEPFTKRAMVFFDALDAEQTDAVAKQAGQSIVQLSPAEEARWKGQVASLTAEWARVTPNGAKVLETFRAEVARIRAGM